MNDEPPPRLVLELRLELPPHLAPEDATSLGQALVAAIRAGAIEPTDEGAPPLDIEYIATRVYNPVSAHELARLLADTFSRSRTDDGGIGLMWDQRSASAKLSWLKVAHAALERT